MLADAAVIGKVFWAGAVARWASATSTSVTDDPAGALAQGARPPGSASPRWRARPSMPSGTSWPAMSPTASSPGPPGPARHVAAASWIESKAPERVEDLADVLAYHYATALELAQAAGQTEQAAELEAPALRFLGPRRRTRPRPRHRRGARELRAGAHAHPAGHPDGPRRWPASARPPLHAGRLAEARGAGGGDRGVPSGG